MITVRLYGTLAASGTRFDLHADTPAEALHALFAQIRGLRRKVADGLFQVRFQGRDYGEDALDDAFRRPASGVLHIVPRTAGAGKAGQLVAGIALLAVAWWNPFGWAAGGAMLSAVTSAGIGMVLGGVAQMLTKQPKLDQGRSGAESSRNTAFSHLANTAAQGQPVPLAYGLVYAGSRVASQGVESRRLATGAAAQPGGFLARWSGIRRPEQAGTPSDPLAVDLTLGMKRTFVAGVAATAPNGQKYNTDFADDSVRARNYTAEYVAE